MEQTTDSHGEELNAKTSKSIRYNVPQNGNPFGDTENFTLHTNGVTIYFESIRTERTGHIFIEDGVEVAYIPNSECDVTPTSAQEYAKNNPGEKVRFAD